MSDLSWKKNPAWHPHRHAKDKTDRLFLSTGCYFPNKPPLIETKLWSYTEEISSQDFLFHNKILVFQSVSRAAVKTECGESSKSCCFFPGKCWFYVSVTAYMDDFRKTSLQVNLFALKVRAECLVLLDQRSGCGSGIAPPRLTLPRLSNGSLCL